MLFLCLLLGGCVTYPRRDAPPGLVNAAVPDRFAADVRLSTADRSRFVTESPEFFRRIRDSATDGSLDILALSGGGSGGAFGAGALVGLTRAHARPRFELVTGVSAGALIAPFAFLGPDWDPQLVDAFSGKRDLGLLHSPALTAVAHLLFPRGLGGRSSLAVLVDRYVTPELVAAVARQGATGRRLIVATTDIDKQETILWDMTAIAARGGEPARELFRDVLVASASVPGVFPPVLIPVHVGDRHYDEMHVDGSVTTPIFVTPLIAEILPDRGAWLRGANLYLIVNGKLATPSRTTPADTLSVLSRSFTSDLTYKTREAILLTLGYAREHGLKFELSEIPIEYPQDSFLDFDPESMHRLFGYAARCAAQGRLWLTPEQSIRRNFGAPSEPETAAARCPAEPAAPVH